MSSAEDPAREAGDAVDPVAAPPPASATDAAAVPPPGPPPDEHSPSAAERPEIQLGAAFAAGFVAALILKRLGG